MQMALEYHHRSGVNLQRATFEDKFVHFLPCSSVQMYQKKDKGGCGKMFLEHPIYDTDSITITGT